jgi:hypothetical protein
MNTAIICCKTIDAELKLAMTEAECDYPIIFIESGLHNYPEKLRARLQEALDNAEAYDRILLAFGTCGNSVVGLRTGRFDLVLPLVDDCITLLLGSSDMKRQHERTYFLTKGWLDGEQNIWWEYQYAMKKYGEETGKSIYSTILSNYRYLGILNTGAYDIAEIGSLTEEIAAELGLEHKILPATTRYLSKLITGPWSEEEFLIIPPESKISAEHVMF